MKKFLPVLLWSFCLKAGAQWNPETNVFYDSLHQPVTTAAGAQRNPLVLTSYPDGGFIIIWEDERNSAASGSDIYAQKYDQNGHALWSSNGIPVADGPNPEHYGFSSNQDYRNRSFACTDSAGGFYLCYTDDSTNNYIWQRVAVQHMRSDGTRAFPGTGHILARSGAPNGSMAPQLIADGNRGFYIAFKQFSGNEYLHVYCYRYENETLKYYGGGCVNENYLQTNEGAPCGIKTVVTAVGTSLGDYSIWPDCQKGCHIVMDMYGNTGSQGKMLAYNRVWRAKRDSRTRTYFRNTSGSSCPRFTEYRKDEVYIMYRAKQDFQSVVCGGGTGPVIAYTNYRLLSNGYKVIDNSGYDYNYPKGATLVTEGNINVTLIAATTRKLQNNTIGNFHIKGYAFPAEKFDSIPYENASYNNPDMGYNPTLPENLNKLGNFRDTLLGSDNNYPDFTLSANQNEARLTALLSLGGARSLRFQGLSALRQTADSFSLEYQTVGAGLSPKEGVAIGKELATGSTSTNMSFELPVLKSSPTGTWLLCTNESGRGPRISPLFINHAIWGAMGRPIASCARNDAYYNITQPVIAMDSTGKTGIVVWKDTRAVQGLVSENIFMQHLDLLDLIDYRPPPRKTQIIRNPFGNSNANPAVLLGTSGSYTALEVFSLYGNSNLSPIMEVEDIVNFGNLKAGINQHTDVIRRYNGIPYLDRNYYVSSENDFSGTPVNALLYFSTAELNNLKSADPTVADPGFLTVIRQPGNNPFTGTAYSPLPNEESASVQQWDIVPGGFRVKTILNGPGNLYIMKTPATTVCSDSSVTFNSDVAGATYQWMVNTGSGYVAIFDNASYSGTGSARLQIGNVPDSFNAYRYACLIDGVKYSKTFLLQVANFWRGTVNDQWHHPGNWSCGLVPGPTTHVVINSGTVHVVLPASCASLQLHPAVQLNVDAGANIKIIK